MLHPSIIAAPGRLLFKSLAMVALLAGILCKRLAVVAGDYPIYGIIWMLFKPICSPQQKLSMFPGSHMFSSGPPSP